ncbi:group 1 truncated hemoglobin [Pseudoalteromonas sp. S4492]|nr:group 1 truncated hemoglobin [Pseudoalteromonas sp. S4492]
MGVVESSLFIKYGGFSRIYTVIVKFYDNILKSETLNAHFKNTNMERLIHHQTSFISSLMGGPDYISDEQLAQAHKNLGINLKDWQEMINILSLTFSEQGISEDDAKQVIAKLEAKRDFIVCH